MEINGHQQFQDILYQKLINKTHFQHFHLTSKRTPDCTKNLIAFNDVGGDT